MEEEVELVERVNKTRVKLEIDALVTLGKAVAALSKDQFEAMPLPDTLKESIVTVRKLTKNGAIKRQYKYIGKLLREMGDDVDGVFQALDKQLDKDRSATARLHQLEHWRDRLSEEGDTALGDFVANFPQADRQHIRQLQRKAKQELEREKPPAAARKIFQYIKEISKQTDSE